MNSIRFGSVYKLQLKSSNQTELSDQDKKLAMMTVAKYHDERVITLDDGQKLLLNNDDKGRDLEAYSKSKDTIDQIVFKGGKLDPGGIKTVLNGLTAAIDFTLNLVTVAKPRQKHAQATLEKGLLAKAQSMEVEVTRSDAGAFSFKRTIQ